MKKKEKKDARAPQTKTHSIPKKEPFKPEWSTTNNDPNAYKLSETEYVAGSNRQIRKKAERISKNHLKGRSDWKDKIERLQNGEITPQDILMAKGNRTGKLLTNIRCNRQQVETREEPGIGRPEAPEAAERPRA